MRTDILLDWAVNNGVDIDNEKLARLSEYQDIVLEVNKHMNLTAITDDEDFTVKHIIDSLTLLQWIPRSARLLDVGTGAGFPGIPLKIIRPDIQLTLMDSLRKRIFFLRETADTLKLKNVRCLHARAEEYIHKPEYRETYDICAARAVARLSKLAGYTLPFIKKGGLLLAMKGPDVSDEIAEAMPVFKKLGAEVRDVNRMEIGLGITHTVVLLTQR